MKEEIWGDLANPDSSTLSVKKTIYLTFDHNFGKCSTSSQTYLHLSLVWASPMTVRCSPRYTSICHCFSSLRTKFRPESDSERILWIGLHLPKLWSKVVCTVFDSKCRERTAVKREVMMMMMMMLINQSINQIYLRESWWTISIVRLEICRQDTKAVLKLH